MTSSPRCFHHSLSTSFLKKKKISIFKLRCIQRICSSVAFHLPSLTRKWLVVLKIQFIAKVLTTRDILNGCMYLLPWGWKELPENKLQTCSPINSKWKSIIHLPVSFCPWLARQTKLTASLTAERNESTVLRSLGRDRSTIPIPPAQSSIYHTLYSGYEWLGYSVWLSLIYNLGSYCWHIA